VKVTATIYPMNAVRLNIIPSYRADAQLSKQAGIPNTKPAAWGIRQMGSIHLL